MKNLRVCLVSPKAPPVGGITNWTRLFEASLSSCEEIDSVSLINTSPGEKGVDRACLASKAMRGIASTIRAYLSARTILGDQSVTIAHICTSGGLSFFRDAVLSRYFKRRGVPTVIHCHFGRIPEIIQGESLEKKLLKITSKYAKAFVCMDRTTEQELSGWLNSDVKIFYLPNPVDIGHVEFECKKEREIIFIGHVIKEKGIDELLEAWDIIQTEECPWVLRIVGPCRGKYKTGLGEGLSKNKIFIEGEVSHVEALKLCKKASILVLPSYSEGFPNCVLEGMALGTVVVASSVGAIPEMLSEKCGFLVQPKDSFGLASMLKNLMNDSELRRAVTENAYNKVCTEYSLDVVTRRLIGIWDSMASGDES